MTDPTALLDAVARWLAPPGVRTSAEYNASQGVIVIRLSRRDSFSVRVDLPVHAPPEAVAPALDFYIARVLAMSPAECRFATVMGAAYRAFEAGVDAADRTGRRRRDAYP